MKTLYIDCGMGIAGDMFAGALLDLVPDREDVLRRLNGMGLHGVEFAAERVERRGIAATRFSVKVHGCEEGHCGHHGHGDHGHHGHSHRSLEDVMRTIGSLALDAGVKESAIEVYRLLADAESAAHGRPVAEIHFHEVGALDAIADIAAVSLMMDILKPCETVASPVNVGGGTVECAHGVMPVPAPATANLLMGIPSYSDGTVQGELCTPTGAALLKRFATRFGPQPLMRVESSGLGAGSRDFVRANVLRVFCGEAEHATGEAEIAKLEFETDDMTGEEGAFASERIFAAGAKDVTTSPVFMKKGRMGIRFTVLCRPEDRGRAVEAIFANTTTLGIRESVCRRYELERREDSVLLPGGETVRRKTALRNGRETYKFEADDIAALARKTGVPFFDARASARGVGWDANDGGSGAPEPRPRRDQSSLGAPEPRPKK